MDTDLIELLLHYAPVLLNKLDALLVRLNKTKWGSLGVETSR